jgi:hypothetical protein
MKAFEEWEIKQPKMGINKADHPENISKFKMFRDIQCESRREGWKGALEWLLRQEGWYGDGMWGTNAIRSAIIRKELGLEEE